MISIDIHHHIHFDPREPQFNELKSMLQTILTKEDLIMATDEQLLTDLNTLNSSLIAIGEGITKIGTETEALLTKVADLEAALANVGNTSPEVDAAMQALKDQAQALAGKVTEVDKKVPDATA